MLISCNPIQGERRININRVSGLPAGDFAFRVVDIFPVREWLGLFRGSRGEEQGTQTRSSGAEPRGATASFATSNLSLFVGGNWSYAACVPRHAQGTPRLLLLFLCMLERCFSIRRSSCSRDDADYSQERHPRGKRNKFPRACDSIPGM